jgi:cell division protease FtsH
MGKSRARRYTRRDERTTFDDVAGVEGAKHELREIIEFLKTPHKFQRLGGEMPKGVLLVGPPGTGKTLLARAVAGEADVPFFIITGSDFMEMFVGVGASRVRDLFKAAKRSAPSIIFIDELDSIGRRRGAGLGGGHDEREQTLNQLLSELDGFEPTESVVVMAATNRPDVLDPALLRPGRFDRRVPVHLPTFMERVDVLRVHARDKPLSPEVDLEKVARGTPGFSGADLENLLNEAALLAARKDKDVIGEEDLEHARDKVLLGLERTGLSLSEGEMHIIAYHEGGHALLAALLPNADPIHKVTILPRGRSMGVTQQLPERDKYLYSQEYIQDRLAVMMGGRAAERLILDTCTNGAENDLKEATRLGRRMVLDWGMSRHLGTLALGGQQEHVFLGREISQRRDYSEETAREIDLEVKAILDQAFQKATELLKENRSRLDEIANTLLEKEEITGEEVQELLETRRQNRRGQKEVSHG